MCVCLYIYICGCMCVGLCVCSWMGGQRRDSYLQHLWATALDCLEGLPLSILAWRPYNELGPCELTRSEVGSRKDKRHWSVKVRTLSLAVKPRTRGQTVKSKTRGRKEYWAVRKQNGLRNRTLSSEGDGQAESISEWRDESSFFVAVRIFAEILQ